LRWSAPTFDRDGQEVVRGYIRRLGKIAGAIIDLLDQKGEMVINEVAEVLGRRARDLRRRNLPRLEEAGVINISDNTVSLVEGWQEALEEERKLKGEIRNDLGEDGAEERDRERYRLQSEAFRNRHKVNPDYHHANVGADGHIEDLQPANVEPEERPPEMEVSPLALAVRDYLDRNPNDACQPAGWIAVTLWAYDVYPNKPTPGELKVAIEELGGDVYLRELLQRARGAA
jgi:hypothetical protein